MEAIAFKREKIDVACRISLASRSRRMGCVVMVAGLEGCQHRLYRVDTPQTGETIDTNHRWHRLARTSRLVSWWGYQNKARSTLSLLLTLMLILRKGLQRKLAILTELEAVINKSMEPCVIAFINYGFLPDKKVNWNVKPVPLGFA